MFHYINGTDYWRGYGPCEHRRKKGQVAKPLIAAKNFLPEKRLGALCSTTLGWKDSEVTWKEDKRPNISTCLTYRNPALPLPPQSDYDLIRIN